MLPAPLAAGRRLAGRISLPPPPVWLRSALGEAVAQGPGALLPLQRAPQRQAQDGQTKPGPPTARRGCAAPRSVPPGDSLSTAPAGCNVSRGAPGPWFEAVQRGHALQLSLLLGPPRIVTDVWVPRTPPVVTARTQSILCQQHPPLPLQLKENPHERPAVQGQDRQWSSSDPLQQRAVVHTILLADRRPHCLVSTRRPFSCSGHISSCPLG